MFHRVEVKGVCIYLGAVTGHRVLGKGDAGGSECTPHVTVF